MITSSPLKTTRSPVSVELPTAGERSTDTAVLMKVITMYSVLWLFVNVVKSNDLCSQVDTSSRL